MAGNSFSLFGVDHVSSSRRIPSDDADDETVIVGDSESAPGNDGDVDVHLLNHKLKEELSIQKQRVKILFGLMTIMFLWLCIFTIKTNYILDAHTSALRLGAQVLEAHTSALQFGKDKLREGEAAVDDFKEKASQMKTMVALAYEELKPLIETIHILKLANGKRALKIDASELHLIDQRTYFVNQTATAKGKKVWDKPSLAVYVGDTVEWSWSGHDDNIISCDEHGVVPDVVEDWSVLIYSGNPGMKNAHSYTFTHEGVYYYTSERTASLEGVVSARAMPSLSVPRQTVGEVRRVPWGVLRALSWEDLGAIDGCFQTCYDSLSLSRTASVSTSGSDSDSDGAVPTSCTGEWVFWGLALASATASSNSFILGAFGKQALSFSPSSVNLTDVIGNRTTVNGRENNGLYWYHLPGRSMGFSSERSMVLQSRYGFVNPGTNSSCNASMSWSVQVQAAASDGLKKSDTDTDSSPGHVWVAAECALWNNDGRHRLVAMTSTCPLLLPPANDRASR